MRIFLVLTAALASGCGAEGLGLDEVELDLAADGAWVEGDWLGSDMREGSWCEPPALAAHLAGLGSRRVAIRAPDGEGLFGFDLSRVLRALERAGVERYAVEVGGTFCGEFALLRGPAEIEASDLRFGMARRGSVLRLPLDDLEPAGGRRVLLELGGHLDLGETCAALSRADGDALRLATHSGPY